MTQIHVCLASSEEHLKSRIVYGKTHKHCCATSDRKLSSRSRLEECCVVRTKELWRMLTNGKVGSAGKSKSLTTASCLPLSKQNIHQYPQQNIEEAHRRCDCATRMLNSNNRVFMALKAAGNLISRKTNTFSSLYPRHWSCFFQV